jgi:hypothetical protein
MTMIIVQNYRAEFQDYRMIVRGKDDRHAAGDSTAHVPNALVLERGIVGAQDLVDDHDLRLAMSRVRKARACIHAVRAPFDLRIDELADTGELHDPIEFPADLTLPHARDRALQEHVLTASRIREGWMPIGSARRCAPQTPQRPQRACGLSSGA